MNEDSELSNGDDDAVMEDAEVANKAGEEDDDKDEEDEDKDEEERKMESPEKAKGNEKSDESVKKADKPKETEDVNATGEKSATDKMFGRMKKKEGASKTLKQQTLPKTVNGGFNNVVYYTIVGPHRQHQTKKEAIRQVVGPRGPRSM